MQYKSAKNRTSTELLHVSHMWKGKSFHVITVVSGGKQKGPSSDSTYLPPLWSWVNLIPRCRARNNSRSKDNVLSNLLNDRSNQVLKGQIDWPYLEREKIQIH